MGEKLQILVNEINVRHRTAVAESLSRLRLKSKIITPAAESKKN